MTIVNISGTARGTSSMSALWSLTHGHTGRGVRGNEGYALAVQWTQAENFHTHPAFEQFAALVPVSPRLAGTSLVCFRGRSVTGALPTSLQMGPPDAAKSLRGGRYHSPGNPALYLSDSEDGVRRELEVWSIQGVPHLQRFDLPVEKLSIADFTQIPDDHFVAAVFSKAEECNLPERELKAYAFSQTVASMVAEHFDGMRVPGVRGAPNSHYTNIVMFRPHPLWKEWLDPTSEPYALNVR